MPTIQNTQRKAIAMIELIFAITIMGIVLLSVPMMLNTAEQSSNVAFQQESIAITASHANTLMTYAWDEKNTESFKVDFGDRKKNILTVANGDSELNTRIPNIARVLDTNLSSPSNTFGTSDGTIPEIKQDDIDDFHDKNSSLSIANATTTTSVSNEDDFMDISITLNTKVFYLDDSANYAACGSTANGCAFSRAFIDTSDDSIQSTNIKRFEVTLTSSNVPDKTIKLNGFMCNIGAGKPVQLGGY